MPTDRNNLKRPVLLGALLLALSTVFLVPATKAEWVKQDTNSFTWFHDVFFLDHRKGWIVGSDGTMLTTEDNGNTWLVSKKFTSDTLLQIHFENQSTGWLLCLRNVYARGNAPISYLKRTLDGGATWDTIEFQDSGRERVTKLLFHDNGRATAFGEGGSFYELQKDRVTWRRNSTGIRYLLLDGAYGSDRTGAIVGAAGTVLFTDDGGFTWERATVLGLADIKINAVDFARNAGWAVGARGKIFRSVGVRLWREVSSGVTANLNDVYFASPAEGWAVGDDGVIIRSTDSGLTWFGEESRTRHRLEKVHFANGRGWAVGYGGTILRYDADSTSRPGNKPVLVRR